MKRHYSLAVAALIVTTVISCLAGSASKPRTRRLVFLYSASARGQIRSCNCTKFRFGGYGRELTLLKQIRSAEKDVLLVEGGDSVGDTGFQAELKAGVTAKALRILGYAAIVPGEEELGIRGVRHLDKFAKDSVPILCGNLFSHGSKQRRYPLHKTVFTPSGLRVCLIGLVSPSILLSIFDRERPEKSREPVSELKTALKPTGTKADLVIVVYHGPTSEARKLATIPGVDLVLAAHRGETNLPFPSGESNIVEAGHSKLGKGILVEAGTTNNWSLGKIELVLDAKGAIAWAKHSVVYLDRRYDEDPAMLAVYDDYNNKVKAAVLNRSVAFKKNAEGILTKRGLNLVELRSRNKKSPFATEAVCMTCHADIHASWAQSRHACAMATLEKSRQDFDPECVTCHATGVIARNGFVNRQETPELVNVQCEACHGPGAAHATSPAKGYGKVEEQTCRSCHTDDRSPDFDFQLALKKIKH